MWLKNWFFGVYNEIEFWRVWMRTHGAFWKSEYARRLRFDTVLDQQAASLLPVDVSLADLRILDVGSGPLSALGVTYQGQRLSVVAADPLAVAYQAMYREFGITPPIPAELAFAEDLTAFFRADEFHLVVCQNALDHTFDPWRALRQMIEVSRPGGFVLLRHARNEAENEEYSGLHQWNLDTTSDGDFVIWNKQTSLNVTQLLATKVRIDLLESTPGHIALSLCKAPGVVMFDEHDAKERLRGLLTELSVTASSLGSEGFLLRLCFAGQTYSRFVIRQLRRLVR